MRLLKINLVVVAVEGLVVLAVWSHLDETLAANSVITFGPWTATREHGLFVLKSIGLGLLLLGTLGFLAAWLVSRRRARAAEPEITGARDSGSLSCNPKSKTQNPKSRSPVPIYDQILSTAPRYYVALLRIFMGAFYLRIAIGRIFDVQADAATFKTRLAAYEAAGQFSWFGWWLQRVVDPLRDSYFFPALWVAAPLLLGVALVLGLFTRTAAALGCVLVAHAWLARFHSATSTDLMMLELQFAVLLALCLAAAGRTCGMDGIWWKRRVAAQFPPSEDRYIPQRIPIFKEVEPIPLSENKPGQKIFAKPDDERK
jgi:uncharacterized membrane protein YphA (DoxX/SURF4 family)